MVADVGQYETKMKSAAKATGQVADQTGRVGSSVGGFGQKVQSTAKPLLDFKTQILAGAAAAGVAVNAVMDLANTAGRLQQSVGATESVFGSASATVTAFAEDSVNAVGLSERAYRELAAVAGAQLKSLGYSQEQAAQTANQLITIGADLAATFGGTTEEAVSALGAAFRGEADPAERFGLRLNQTAVNAKAVELGLADTTSAVDANAKAQATLALIMEQSADSAGQFAREADTLAGAQQRANAEWEDAKAALGENLLPLVTQATEQFGGLLGVITNPGWESFTNVIENAGNPLDRLSRSFASWLTGAKDATKDLHELNKAGAGAAEAARDHAEALERNEERLKGVADAIDGVTEATFASIDADFAMRRAMEGTNDARDDLNQLVRDGKRGTEEYSDALMDTERSILAEADAAVRQARTLAEAAGKTFGAADETRVYRQRLEDLKRKFPELAPVIDGYIGRLNAVPRNVQSNLNAVANTRSVDAAVSEMQNRLTALGVPVIIAPGRFAVARAQGGVDANIVTRPTVLYGERQTGAEAFIPQKGISKQRAVDILGEAAHWYGYGLAEMAQGGFVWPVSMAKDYLKNLGVAPALGAGIGWQKMWAALHAHFPWARLFSAFRPGAITATGNPSYHGKGRAIDVSPSMDIFNWLAGNYPNSREIIYSPAGSRQIRNGGRHFYGEPTRGDHWDHVHWAMAHGGIIGGGTPQRVTETINVVVDGAVLAQTQRSYNRNNTGR
jgi:hypothetical protein